ncbi:MAG: hypothetical protein AABY15_08820 [Nanoarchaeota archaeon]
MTTNIKDIGTLARELAVNSNGNFPLVVLDTGGLIDIESAIRQSGSRYTKTTDFLKHISESIPVIITPKTYQEIQDHGRMILNTHTTELSPKIVDYALETMISSNDFISGLKPGLELDKARYDAYWAAKNGCNGNAKKHEEGCSDTDKEILSMAAFLSQCRTPANKHKKMGEVLIISPDAHIVEGTRFLRKSFNGKYSNIVPISTRY